jgi:beta-barrel assembly-enhancing protease
VTARFFDGERAAAHAVTVRVSAGALLVQSEDGTALACWPLDRIDCPGGLDPDGKAVLASKGGPARLVIDDPDCVTVLVQSGLRLRAVRGWGTQDWTLAACLLLAVLAGGALLLDAGPRLAARLLPAAWENRLGDLVETRLQRDHRVCTAQAGQVALEALVDRLRIAGGIARKVRIEVLDDPMVNAVTLPGGRVVVMRGLIDKVQDGGELAGVIAHELGHVAHRDPTTLLLRQMGLGLIAGSLGWNDSFANAGGIAQQLLTMSYSRRAEAAADASGEAFLSGAGLRADGLGRFFAQLETIEGHGAGIAWLATHPPTAQRLAHATRSTAGAPPLSDAEWQAVRGMCR